MLQYILLKKHNNMNFPKKSSFSRRQEYLLLDLRTRERMIQRGERGGIKKGETIFSRLPFLSKSAATYSPTFTQYHRRGQA